MSGWSGGVRDGKGAWTNAKDQRFEVDVTSFADGEITLSLSITYDMRDRVVVTKGRYRLQGTLVNDTSGNVKSSRSRVAVSRALGVTGWKVDPRSHHYGGRYVSFEEVKQKFSSSDNCGYGGSTAQAGPAEGHAEATAPFTTPAAGPSPSERGEHSTEADNSARGRARGR